MSFLEAEIQEQPEVLARLVESQIGHAHDLARIITGRDIRYIIIAARGSSDNAARYAKYLFGALNGLPVMLATPSLFTLYNRPPHFREALVIGISQSGQSPDIVKVIEEGQRQNALTLAITNDSKSPLALAAECCLLLEAGEERSLAATKTYVAQLAALALLSASLSGITQQADALRQLPEAVEQVLVNAAAPASHAAERWLHAERGVVIGRGYNYATAFEIALKLAELVYLPLQPYSSADFRHGPLALVDDNYPALFVAPGGGAFADVLDLLQAMRTRGADLLVISDQAAALDCGAVRFPLPPDIPEWLTPLIAVLPGQVLALRLAEARGLNPDQPRGLHKITKTT